jgi:hypothetical protein
MRGEWYQRALPRGASVLNTSATLAGVTLRYSHLAPGATVAMLDAPAPSWSENQLGNGLGNGLDRDTSRVIPRRRIKRKRTGIEPGTWRAEPLTPAPPCSDHDGFDDRRVRTGPSWSAVICWSVARIWHGRGGRVA